MTPEKAAAMFPMLADAPHLRPFAPERFAGWAIGAGKPDTAAALLSVAGFVLAFIPPAERTPLVAALAWPSPTDEAHAHRGLVVLHERDRAPLLAWLRASWMAEMDAKVGRAILAALASPARVAALLRLDAVNGDDARGVTARCPKSGGVCWAPSRDTHDGRSIIPARQEHGRSHRCVLTTEANALRFRCEACRFDGDVFSLVAAVRGIDPKNRGAIQQAAAQLAAAS